MNSLLKLIGLIISIPARIKGMKIGKNSFIGPGYDLWFVTLKGIILGNNIRIGKNAWLQNSRDDADIALVIGDSTSIGRNITISARNRIEMGKKLL